MGHNYVIRGNDGEIEQKIWRVAKDANGNDLIIDGYKVLENPNEKRKYELPIESNSAEAYLKYSNTGQALQVRVYDIITHKAIMDIDLNREVF